MKQHDKHIEAFSPARPHGEQRPETGVDGKIPAAEHQGTGGNVLLGGDLVLPHVGDQEPVIVAAVGHHAHHPHQGVGFGVVPRGFVRGYFAKTGLKNMWGVTTKEEGIAAVQELTEEHAAEPAVHRVLQHGHVGGHAGDQGGGLKMIQIGERKLLHPLVLGLAHLGAPAVGGLRRKPRTPSTKCPPLATYFFRFSASAWLISIRLGAKTIL